MKQRDAVTLHRQNKKISLLYQDYANVIKIYENKKVYPAPVPYKAVQSEKFDSIKVVSNGTPTLFVTDDGIKLRVNEPSDGDSNFVILNCDVNVWISIRVSF